MKVLVNKEEQSTDDNSSLISLLNKLKIKSNGIAIAVNQSVVPKDNWHSYILKENDDIMIITATCGG